MLFLQLELEQTNETLSMVEEQQQEKSDEPLRVERERVAAELRVALDAEREHNVSLIADSFAVDIVLIFFPYSERFAESQRRISGPEIEAK